MHTKKPKRKVLKVLLVSGCVLEVLLIALIVFLLVRSPSYERPVKAYINLLNTRWELMAAKDIYTMTPVKLIQNINVSKEYDQYNLFESEEDLLGCCEDFVKSTWENMDDMYGDDIKVTYEVSKSKNFKRSELRELQESYEGIFGLDGNLVEDAMTLDVRVRFKGSKDKYNNKRSITVIQVDGKWYFDIFYIYQLFAPYAIQYYD